MAANGACLSGHGAASQQPWKREGRDQDVSTCLVCMRLVRNTHQELCTLSSPYLSPPISGRKIREDMDHSISIHDMGANRYGEGSMQDFSGRKMMGDSLCSEKLHTSGAPSCDAVCGTSCEKTAMKVQAFVHGFLICRVLCSLLNNYLHRDMTVTAQDSRSLDTSRKETAVDYAAQGFSSPSDPNDPCDPSCKHDLPGPPGLGESTKDTMLSADWHKLQELTCESSQRPAVAGDQFVLSSVAEMPLDARRKNGGKFGPHHHNSFEQENTGKVQLPAVKTKTDRFSRTKIKCKAGTGSKGRNARLNHLSPRGSSTHLHGRKSGAKGVTSVQSSRRRLRVKPASEGQGFTVQTEGSSSCSERHPRNLACRSSDEKIMVCRLCEKKCVGQAGLSVHMQNRHFGEKPVECEMCGERFTSSRECEKHRKKAHDKTEGVCDVCGKHFKYKHALLAHIKAHTGVRGFVCEQCGKSFIRMTTLCTHRKRAHCCRVCSAELVSDQCPMHPSHSQSKEKRPSLLESLNMLQCRECGKVLDSLQKLEAHHKEHRMLRPFRCQVCGNGFHTSSSLAKHNKQHQEKRFKCTSCDKTFTYKCNMQKHLETHVEGRPFQCEFCSKTFKTKGVMDKHTAMHIEDRQYKCQICGKGLTRLQTLKNHISKMHPKSAMTGNCTDHLESVRE